MALAAAAALAFSGACAQAQGQDFLSAAGAGIDGINSLETPLGAGDQQEKAQLRDLYSYGLVLPNQPLQMAPETREEARQLVQQSLRASGAARMGRAERDVVNAVLFNYGLQVLDDGRVVILDMYYPDPAQGVQPAMLAPGIPMPAGAVTITRENLGRIHDSAARSAAQSRAAKAGASQGGSALPPITSYDAEMGIK